MKIYELKVRVKENTEEEGFTLQELGNNLRKMMSTIYYHSSTKDKDNNYV